MKPVEVVIACHSPERSLARAVGSVLVGNGGVAQATVVAHNVPVGELKAIVPGSLVNSVRWISFTDHTRSPANPYNYGMDRVRGEWVSLLGSDDYLQSGAVASWLHRSEGMDAVITRLMLDDGGVVRTPPVRPFPHRRRNAVRDRLYYRSAPLGLMRSAHLRRQGLHWESNLNAGGDLRLSSLLWSEGRVAVQRRGPGYVIGSDATDRVTMRLAPLVDEFAHLEAAWNPGGWAASLGLAQRTALATKQLRIHFFGAAYYRAVENAWGPGDRDIVADRARLVLTSAADAAKPLSIADRRLLDALLDPSVPDSTVNRLAIARRRFGAPSTLIPRDLSYLLQREAPLRFMVASALVR